jgi:outer membrane protein assembly factor BamD (BamD/ComL family)
MKQSPFLILFCFNLLLFSSSSLEARQTLKRSAFSNEMEAECYLTTHYNLACEAYGEQEWKRAAVEFEKVIFYFPNSTEAAKAYYYLGICQFYKKEFDSANAAFNGYLKSSEQPEFFEDVIKYKFCIAEHLRQGYRKRLFDNRYCPKIESGTDLALTIYDEVIAALPYCDLSAQALFAKAELLKKTREYREAVETYQTLIRRFPKHEVIPACYLGIQDAYCQQSRHEFQSPELIALAELNARRFRDEFPRDERVAIADHLVSCVKEAYAQEFCKTGLYFERKQKPAAAAIYFQSAIEEFPKTQVAQFCRGRLRTLGYTIEEDEVPVTNILNQKPLEEETGLGDRENNPLGPELPTGPEAIREKAEGVPLITGSVNDTRD